LQKRRKQPERYVQLRLKFYEFLKIVLTKDLLMV
jgi:hypothetical protein